MSAPSNQSKYMIAARGEASHYGRAPASLRAATLGLAQLLQHYEEVLQQHSLWNRTAVFREPLSEQVLIKLSDCRLFEQCINQMKDRQQ